MVVPPQYAAGDLRDNLRGATAVAVEIDFGGSIRRYPS